MVNKNKQMALAGGIIAAAAYFLVNAPIASATKTATSPVNFTILFSNWQLGVTSTYCPGQNVNYDITISNPNSTGHHSVVFNSTFPEAVSCFAVTPQSRCTLSGNRLACNIGDLSPSQRVAFTVNCQVKTTAPLHTSARAWASISSTQSPSPSQGFLDFMVECPATTPTATPTRACTHTPAPPTPTPVPVCTYTPVPPTWTPTPTSTPTPACTDTTSPACTNTPVPPTPSACTPSVCHHEHDPVDDDNNSCETFAIERKVSERWNRNRIRPVAIREEVEVLPAGKDLTCLEAALQSNTGGCLSYDKFRSCSDPLLRRQLAREGAVARCFGLSNMTLWLLNQACDQDAASKECSQFLALNTYQSNNYPMGAEATGVELCEDHNPRSQVFIIDSQCRLILNPTEQQKNESCTAAFIHGQSYSQGSHKRSRR